MTKTESRINLRKWKRREDLKSKLKRIPFNEHAQMNLYVLISLKNWKGSKFCRACNIRILLILGVMLTYHFSS